jgi:outer membrane protein assembly factor BamB
MRRRLVSLGASLVLLATGGVLSGPSLAGAATTEWPTYHHDALRTGDAALPGTLTTLATTWQWNVPQPLQDQNLYAEPLIADGLVIVTSESNWVYAISATTGQLAWSTNLGHPEFPASGVCGNVQTPDQPSIGITSTPVIDPQRGELFVVAAIGTGAGYHDPVRQLFGLNLLTGATALNRNVEPGGASDSYQLQRAALAEDQGNIIIGFGGNAGDCGSYHGWLESVSASSTSTPIARFEVDSGPGQNQGAIWMGGAAPTVDAAGHIFVATGNGSSCSPTSPYDGSDSVLELSVSMKVVGRFAPPSFRSDNCNDRDLGSGAPQLMNSGALLQIGKTHRGYLLRPPSLGGVGARPSTVSVCPGGQANGGDAVVTQTSSKAVVAIPCSGGLQEVAVTAVGSAMTGMVRWTSSAATGPPIMAAGSLIGIVPGRGGGTLDVLNPRNGSVRLTRSIGPVTNHFDTPAAGEGLLIVASAGSVYAIAPTAPSP